MNIDSMVANLNDTSLSVRLSNVKKVAALIDNGSITMKTSDEVNNHVHTVYSFSPYSPAMAAYHALRAGLQAVGIMDHDSVAGAREMISACAIFNIASTVGFELRVNFEHTVLQGRKINNPDSENIGYIALHGIPHKRLTDVERFLKPVNDARNKRNQLMIERLNHMLEPHHLEKIDFKSDVYDKSKASEGGCITERHLLYALSQKLIKQIGRGEKLVLFLKERFGIYLEDKLATYLSDETNFFYIYDLLGALKSGFLETIYIQPDFNECIAVGDAVSFGNAINAIPVYAYLGDIADSTGDKKAEKFEDDFLDVLFPELQKTGFKGITYMPPRNSLQQLLRIQSLCKEYDFFEISGVDINSPRQTFNCPVIKEENFSHLIDSTWALIAHEKLATYNERYGLFNPDNPVAQKLLQERILLYAAIGRKIDHRCPENVSHLIEHFLHNGE